MFWYILSNNPFLKKYSTFFRVMINLFRIYFTAILAIDGFGAVFLKILIKDTHEAVAYINNLPELVRLFLIHSLWLLVILLIAEIVIDFVVMAKNSKENHYRGGNLLQVVQEKWRFIIPNALCFSFGIFAILVTILFCPALGIGIFLMTVHFLLDPLTHSVTLTTRGVLITRTFGDVFFLYEKLYSYTDSETRRCLDTSVFILKFSNITDETFEIKLRCPYNSLESLVNLYQEKTKEAQANKVSQQDSINAN